MSFSWDSPFLDLQRQVDQAFDELIYRPWAISGRASWRPPIDVEEVADAYVVQIDLPGIVPEQIGVLVSAHHLTISGKREPESLPGVLSQRCERPWGKFHRSVEFVHELEPQQAQAEYRYGTCRIRLPKKQLVSGREEPKGEPYSVLRLSVE